MKILLTTLALLSLSCCSFRADNPLKGILSPKNLEKAELVGVEMRLGERPDTVVLRFASNETEGKLVVAVPESGRDWTPYSAFTFEFVSDSTIRWHLDIHNRQGKVFTYRVHPYQNVPVKAAISASFLQREYMNNRAFKGHWLSNWSNHIDLTEVETLTVRVEPNREVMLQLGPLALVSELVSDEVYIDKPVVDELGQWLPLEWVGKFHSLDELKQAWKKEDAELARTEDFGFCRYGGWRERREHATGFFHVAEIDGKWWLVDPDGHLFFSTGIDCVRYRDASPMLTDREKLFTSLPPAAGDTADYYHANARLRYTEAEFVKNWKAKATQRLKAWGFNTVANWSDPAMYEDPTLPFVTNVRVGRSDKGWERFPNVYSEEFVRSAQEDAVRQCGLYRNEPKLIGYFIGNEPRWPRRNLLDRILKDPEATETQNFLRRYLEQKGDTLAVREVLLETISRRYFQVVADAIRKADPNHMVLGIRWAGNAPDPVLKANDVFDVFSINMYRFEPSADQIHHISNLVKKPVLIGEFHFGAVERGLAPSLVMVKDQTERGVAYQYYVERAAAQAPIVGAHYFQLCDQPVTGRFDGENYNLGFVNVVDLPYPEIVSFAKAAHRRVYAVHAGRLAPTERTARIR